MTLDEAIEFIVAKTELLAEHAGDPQQREFLQKWLKNYDEMWRHPRLSLQQLRSIDGGLLDQFLASSILPPSQAEIRRKLVARFKTSRLRKPDATFAQRVLKRGHIADLEEYYQVKEFVSRVENIEVVGEENYGILDSLLGNYDGPGEELPEPEPIPAAPAATKPSRRRPPPPCDLMLVEDEKRCAPSTPVDTRAAFVRAKIALVAQRIADPAQREALRTSLLMTLDSKLAQAQTAEARRAATEWSEHEADCFPGYQVDGAAHREIEAELEKDFGFRRLEPSAQERLRRMLQANDALDRLNRLVVERFIYAYPHQTLFSRAEMKRARELLKQPSPSQPPQPPTMTPRPKGPPDLSQLCVGAVYEVKHDQRPHKVIAFDELEVFYDVGWGAAHLAADESWTFGLTRRRCIYYRHATPLFLDGAKRLRVDEPTPEFVALHRPDLPLRFARTPDLQWQEKPFAGRDAFRAHLEKTAPSLLQHPPLHARELVLIPRSAKGAFQRGVPVQAENGLSFPIAEILWHAHQLQRPWAKPGMTGSGIYRCGLEKEGVPSYLLSCYIEPGGLMEWHEKAPPAP